MPNSLGTLASGVILQTALDLVFTARPALRLFTLDLSSEQCQYGSTITTRTLSIPAVQNFGTGAYAKTDTDVTVTLNNHKEVHHAFTVAEYSGTNRDLVMEAAQPIAEAMANHMVDTLAAAVTVANFPAISNGNDGDNPTVQANGHDYDFLVNIRAALAKRGAPQSGRYLICNSTVYKNLLKDDIIASQQTNPVNAAAVARGEVPQIAGLAIAEYPDLPSNSENLIAFAGCKDALVLAARVQKDPRTVASGLPFPGNIGVVTSPKTGLSVLVTEWIDPSTLVVNTRISWMYGVAKGQVTNLQRVTSA